MYTLLLIVHILACFIMVAVILLQSGKGAEMGAAFGGSSQTLFGSRGAATFLSKVTTVTAAVFLVSALVLAILSKERSVSSSVIQLQESTQGVVSPEETVPPAASEAGEGEPPVAGDTASEPPAPAAE